MSKLHEILAVEGDREKTAKAIQEETSVAFYKKEHLFEGFTRSLKMLVDNETNAALEAAEKEVSIVTETVPSKLEYMAQRMVGWFDVTLQKDVANSKAVADIVVEGKKIAEKVPATYLLALEKRLAKLRPVYLSLPTLDPDKLWVPDATAALENTWRTQDPVITKKTAKTIKHKVLYEATDRHPAQIKEYSEEDITGTYEKNSMSGKITPANKATMLHRLDVLTEAVKRARMRANGQEIEDVRIGQSLFDYIHGK